MLNCAHLLTLCSAWAVPKHKKAAKPMPLDDALDYHPNERRTTAVTARGRRVNRLQLCEEDHSEDNAETGNRRSKHHNPWSVLLPPV